ncbi:hypothetical protein HZA75_02160, partial [Candidatus Roizmanbacteria bacterium]|nr:hypothetical protein [Candidatus Roizmanbacteria bacterium]
MNNKANWQIKNIAIKDLLLWDENARFPDKYFNTTEKELIEYFILKKDFKIKELAEAIIKDFDLPQIEKIVVYEYDERLIVLEGNRRLTVYKLLDNPSLTSNGELKSFFEMLKLKININNNFLIESLISKDREQGLRYIDRKHVFGNNEIGWKDTERALYNARRGRAKKIELFKIALTKNIKKLDIPEPMKEQVLGSGYVTNFYRIVESNPAWQLFGFSLSNSGDLKIKDKDFSEKLKVIIFNVLKKEDFKGNKIDSRSLNKNSEKERYLKSINKDDFVRVEKEIKNSKVKNIFGEESINISKPNLIRSNPKSTTRNYLIPKTCTLQIQQTKINNVYHELKNDLLIDDTNKAVPNAVGVLFRVFLEISIDFFLEKSGIILKNDVKLAGKITKAVECME